jgi:hypothetical protein
MWRYESTSSICKFRLLAETRESTNSAISSRTHSIVALLMLAILRPRSGNRIGCFQFLQNSQTSTTYVRMTNSPVACAQVVNANWDSMMTRILGRRQEPNNYVVLSIHGSEGFTAPGHTSRQNPVHAEYIVYLVLQNYKADVTSPQKF